MITLQSKFDVGDNALDDGDLNENEFKGRVGHLYDRLAQVFLHIYYLVSVGLEHLE